MNQPSDNVATGLMRQQKQAKLSEASKENEQIQKQTAERNKKAVELKAKAEKEGLNTESNKGFDPLAFAMQDINLSTNNKAFRKDQPVNIQSLDLFFGQDPYAATSYFKNRQDQLNSQINNIRQKIQDIDYEKGQPYRGDIHGLVKTPVIQKEYPKEKV